MAKFTRCDKCDKEVGYGEFSPIRAGYDFYSEGKEVRFSFDLCNGCLSVLYKWVKDGV